MVCVGLTVLDVVQRVAEPVAWGRKHVSIAAEVAAGGPAANAAVCAARLLGSAVLVTGLGDSRAAAVVRAELESYAVRVVDLAPPGWSLPVAACLVDAAGERTVVSPGALTTSWRLPAEAVELVARADVLLLDGHHPAAAGAALAALAGASAGPPRPLSVLDAGSAKPHAEEWLGRLDVVASSADYAAGLGLDAQAAVAHILAAGAGAAVMTDGARDILWAQRRGSAGRVTPPTVAAVDTLGAGDAFHGGLAAALAAGLALAPAVGFAAQVGAARVATAGARSWLDALPPPTGRRSH